MNEITSESSYYSFAKITWPTVRLFFFFYNKILLKTRFYLVNLDCQIENCKMSNADYLKKYLSDDKTDKEKKRKKKKVKETGY